MADPATDVERTGDEIASLLLTVGLKVSMEAEDPPFLSLAGLRTRSFPPLLVFEASVLTGTPRSEVGRAACCCCPALPFPLSEEFNT